RTRGAPEHRPPPACAPAPPPGAASARRERRMTRLRFGVIGCGAIVTLHQLPALRRCSQLDLVGVVDRDCEWAGRVARRFGIPPAPGDAAALVGAVDAVLIATPNTTHAAIACDLLEQGVHVLCEKPLATSRADVDRMLDAAARGGARLM